jgi:RNA polymerase sigma-70 factor (ECF subfamily)
MSSTKTVLLEGTTLWRLMFLRRAQTFCPAPSSISQEKDMEFAALALPWKITMAGQPATQEQGLPGSYDPGNSAAGARDPAEAHRLAEVRAADRALADGCRHGHLKAYEHLYQTHGAKLKSLAVNLLGNRHDAEDAVQETFLKIHRSVANFKGESSFSTWVYRILVNTCHDMRRKKLRRQESPKANPSLRLTIERSLTRLSLQQRDVFLLFEVEGFRHSEIAGMLAISEAASKNALFQAKKSLRLMLTEPPGAPPTGTRT